MKVQIQTIGMTGSCRCLPEVRGFCQKLEKCRYSLATPGGRRGGLHPSLFLANCVFFLMKISYQESSRITCSNRAPPLVQIPGSTTHRPTTTAVKAFHPFLILQRTMAACLSFRQNVNQAAVGRYSCRPSYSYIYIYI